MTAKYWHKLPQEEIDAIPPDMLVSKLQKFYKQPVWCSYPKAIHPLGCWSLIRDNRKNISRKYCKSCDLFIIKKP
jgi:hypothetical protein